MKHFSLLIIVISTVFLSCKKQEDPLYSVTYHVDVTNTSTTSFTTTYTGASSTNTEGPITTLRWTSQTFKKKTGAHVTLTVDGGSGSGTFTFTISVQGVVQKTGTFDNPFGPKTIEYDLQ